MRQIGSVGEGYKALCQVWLMCWTLITLALLCSTWPPAKISECRTVTWTPWFTVVTINLTLKLCYFSVTFLSCSSSKKLRMVKLMAPLLLFVLIAIPEKDILAQDHPVNAIAEREFERGCSWSVSNHCRCCSLFVPHKQIDLARFNTEIFQHWKFQIFFGSRLEVFAWFLHIWLKWPFPHLLTFSW